MCEVLFQIICPFFLLIVCLFKVTLQMTDISLTLIFVAVYIINIAYNFLLIWFWVLFFPDTEALYFYNKCIHLVTHWQCNQFIERAVHGRGHAERTLIFVIMPFKLSCGKHLSYSWLKSKISYIFLVILVPKKNSRVNKFKRFHIRFFSCLAQIWPR